MTWASKASDSIRSFEFMGPSGHEDRGFEARQQMTGDVMIGHRMKGRAAPL